jgi:hypothetical protein
MATKSKRICSFLHLLNTCMLVFPGCVRDVLMANGSAYRMIRSARNSTSGGMVSPSAVATCRLIVNSK